jgi:hypothetical protein
MTHVQPSKDVQEYLLMGYTEISRFVSPIAMSNDLGYTNVWYRKDVSEDHRRSFIVSYCTATRKIIASQIPELDHPDLYQPNCSKYFVGNMLKEFLV